VSTLFPAPCIFHQAVLSGLVQYKRKGLSNFNVNTFFMQIIINFIKQSKKTANIGGFTKKRKNLPYAPACINSGAYGKGAAGSTGYP